MFKWLRRRMYREHAKLLIQNSYACEVLAEGWFAEKSEIRDYLRRRKVTVDGLKMQFDLETGLPQEAVAQLLELNKELRRLHDAGPAVMGKGFDAAYRPLGGYDDTINRLFAEDY